MGSLDNLNLTKASYFTQQLTTLKQQLPSILDDFEKYYVFYNMNPLNNEYQKMFENIKNNMDTVTSKILSLSNSVETGITTLNTKMQTLDNLIQKEKVKNNQLKKKLGIIEQKGNSSEILINNYKQLYDINYLNNWSLFLSILTAGFAIYKISANKIHSK
jgi:hypothetical protein